MLMYWGLGLGCRPYRGLPTIWGSFWAPSRRDDHIEKGLL